MQTKRQQTMEKLSNWLLLGVLAITFGVACSNAEAAAPNPPGTINAIASAVAGKPATVTCTFNADVWDEQVQAATFNQRRGSTVAGYAFTGGDVAHLGPQACYALYDGLIYGPVWAGVGPLAFGLLTLLHEAVHLRGVLNEGETDCIALGLVRAYTDEVGVRATVAVPVNDRGRYTIKRKVNPLISLVVKAAQAHHNNRPVEYRGNC